MHKHMPTLVQARDEFLAARLEPTSAADQVEMWRRRYEDAVQAGLLKMCWDDYHARLLAAHKVRQGMQAQVVYEPPLCTVCMTNKVQAAFLPCGHRCACIDCALEWSRRFRVLHGVPSSSSATRCPYCSSPAASFQRIRDP